MSTNWTDAEGVAVVGAPIDFVVTILQDGEPLDLSGKTVTATVRSQGSPNTPLHASLEGHEVTAEDPSAGEVVLALTGEETAHLDAASSPAESRMNYVQFVVDGEYAPEMLRFKARRPAAELGGS